MITILKACYNDINLVLLSGEFAIERNHELDIRKLKCLVKMDRISLARQGLHEQNIISTSYFI